MELSFDELRNKIAAALGAKFGTDAFGSPAYIVCDVYPGYVIARGPDEDLYQISYTMGDTEGDGLDDDPVLGDPQEVEVAYVPVSESAAFVQEDAGPDDAFRVQVLQAGFAHGAVTIDGKAQNLPHYFTPQVVAEVAEAVNGARFGRRHPRTADEATSDADRIAGWLDGGKVVGDKAEATVHIFESEKDMRSKLSSARSAGKLNLFGVSIYGTFAYSLGTIEGKKALVMNKLAKLTSVDLCAEPGAGGKFLNPLQIAASSNSMIEIAEMQRRAIKTTKTTGSSKAGGEGAHMKTRIAKVLEALRKRNAARADELNTKFNAAKEEQYPGLFAEISEALADATTVDVAAAATTTTVVPTTATAATGDAQVKEMLARAERLDAKNRIETKLVASKLPQPAMALVREHLKDQTPDDSAIDAEIVTVREAFAAFSQVGKVKEGAIVKTGLETLDKVQLAMDGLLGVKEALKSGVKAFRGIREAYQFMTGDVDCTFQNGGFARVTEAIATTDFPNVLLNSMTKRLLQDYAEVGMGGLEKVITTANIADYKSNDRIRMGYLGDIPVVAEAAIYTELTKPTDEKISYVVQKRGGVLTISEETIKNDDLGKIAQFPNRLARAARRTLKQFITNFFINNPAYDPDTLALFVAGHNNLTVNVLSSANMDAAELLLLNQTEKDSAKPLGLPLNWLMVPNALKATAMQINNNMTGTNNWYQRLGANAAKPDGIIVNELLSSTTRWWVGCYPGEAPGLEIGYLDGIQEPQLFMASDPTVGLRFTNDQIVYKSKFVFGGKPIDFRFAVQNN